MLEERPLLGESYEKAQSLTYLRSIAKSLHTGEETIKMETHHDSGSEKLNISVDVKSGPDKTRKRSSEKDETSMHYSAGI